jgi:signal transduction histidine kinase
VPTPPEVAPLADVVSDCVARFDLGLRYTYVNAAAASAAGLPADRILGRTNEELGVPADLCLLWRREAAAALGEARTFLFDVPLPPGVRQMQACLLPERDAAGRITGMMAVVRELTDTGTLEADRGTGAGMAIENARLFDAEREARRRSDLLRRVAEGLSGALTAVDAARVVVTAARQAAGAAASIVWLLDERAETLDMAAADGYESGPPPGYGRLPLDADLPVCDALRGKAPVFVSSPEERATRYPTLGARTAGGFKAWAAVPLLAHGRALGAAALSFAEPRPFSADDSSHLAAMGLQAAQAIARARLYEAEQSARETAEALHAETAVLYRLSDAANRARSPEPVSEAALDAIRDLLGAARSSILLFDAAGVIRFVAWRGLSEEYRAAVTGHSPWSPETQSPQAIVVPDVREDAGLAAFLPVFEKERIRALAFIPLVYGNRLLGKFMVYAAEPRALDARELDRAGVIAAQVASAVGRVQAEDAMRDTNRRKDEFLAMLSHELRNPLAAARNAVHLLTTVPGDEAARARWVDVIARQTGNLVRIVDDLLDVSRITRGRIELRHEDVDLRDIVSRALAACASVLAPHRVSVILPEEALWVAGDPVRLEQVVVNLLVNAAKYTPPPGDVSIAAGRVNGELVLRVRDTGIGIEAERLARVFDLFDQGGRDLARAQGGLGIGLTIVRGILELHGGSVAARSDGQGNGTEFVVRLPAAAAVSAAVRPPLAEAASSRPRRVLIVDDHVDSAEMLSVMLEAWGHVVGVVTDSAQALARARDFRPDLVLLDIGLPGLSGYDVAAQLQGDELARSAMLVALTGYGQPADRERAFACGFSDHMVKPVQPDTLRELLGRLPS